MRWSFSAPPGDLIVQSKPQMIEVFMKFEIFGDADEVARRAADIIAADARAAVAARGRFIMAVSGGHTPWVTLRDLANEEVPWADVHVFQIDERVAPANDP